MAKAIQKPLQTEIEKFNALASRWWDPHGPMAPLHWMNPARLDFIYRHLDACGIAPPAKGLDIGCGAGLLTEPLARYGFNMTGIDGAADAVSVAQDRIKNEQLNIRYQVELSHNLTSTYNHYNFITALEIIEHVKKPERFITEAVSKLKPGGLIFISTLNRTLKSRIFSIYLAEYILRVLPVGTHEAKSFIRPSELTQWLQDAGCEIVDMAGMTFQPLMRSFVLDPANLDINYIVCARRL